MTTALTVVVLTCFAYLVLVTLVAIAFLVVGAFENAVRKHDADSNDFATLEASRFTIPVSVIVAAYDEEVVIESTVRSLLAFDYPEFEVVVVNDGSSDGTLARLQEAFGLVPYETFVRRIFTTRPVRGIHRNPEFPNLVVVDKENGGKADSWNAALNVARFRYVCGVDADTVFDRKALLMAMRVAVNDPARIVGVTSQITTARDPEKVLAAPAGRRHVDGGLLGLYQHLDFIRAFLSNRLAWSRHGFMMCAPGGFQIWRRDVLEEVGGYSTNFTCEDIELTFRIHERYRREGRDYEIRCLPDSVGVTEGPDDVAKLVSQRERWQRVINETVFHYRRMWFNRRYGSVGMIGAPFYLLTEVLSPAIEVLALASLAVAVALGIFDVQVFLVVLAAMAFTNAALTAGAILLDDLQSRLYRVRDLVRLLFWAPFDMLLYRPIIAWARFKGTWRFLRGDKAWHKFERNSRPPAQTASR
jgi:biofilm PGA synthesis N-glycosyltransferase PgaC